MKRSHSVQTSRKSKSVEGQYVEPNCHFLNGRSYRQFDVRQHNEQSLLHFLVLSSEATPRRCQGPWWWSSGAVLVVVLVHFGQCGGVDPALCAELGRGSSLSLSTPSCAHPCLKILQNGSAGWWPTTACKCVTQDGSNFKIVAKL